ncbi:MAG TPA: VOC family protein [Puia sp.]|jgi:catechol 2,3-dioxygenase-like lactoylglutathione lyase family enzyme
MDDQTVSVRYIVHDVDEAIAFYKDFLGFELLMHPAPPFAIIARGNLRLLLSQPGSGGGGHAASDGQLPEPGGWNRIHIPVDDLETVFRDLKSKGAGFKSEMVQGVGGKQVLLLDPSGNLVELFEYTMEKGKG